jgi:hypothetical protein
LIFVRARAQHVFSLHSSWKREHPNRSIHDRSNRMISASGTLRTGALCAAVALGALGTSVTPAAAHYYTTRCDRDGDDCYRVRCDNDGDDCERVNGYYRHNYYRPRSYGYGYGYSYGHPYGYSHYGSYGNGYYGNGYYRNHERDEEEDEDE